jgi:hypothetical protein
MQGVGYLRGRFYDVDPEGALGKKHFRFSGFDEPMPHAAPKVPQQSVRQEEAKRLANIDYTLVPEVPPEAMGLAVEDEPAPKVETVPKVKPGQIPEI